MSQSQVLGIHHITERADGLYQRSKDRLEDEMLPTEIGRFIVCIHAWAQGSVG